MKNFFKTAGEIIKEFATRNWGMKLISVLLAFLVWCSVVAGTGFMNLLSDVERITTENGKKFFGIE